MQTVQAHIEAIIRPIVADTEFRAYITTGEEIDALRWLVESGVATERDEIRLLDLEAAMYGVGL